MGRSYRKPSESLTFLETPSTDDSTMKHGKRAAPEDERVATLEQGGDANSGGARRLCTQKEVNVRFYKSASLLLTGVLLAGADTFAQPITEFPLPAGSAPLDIVAGPDGNLWFTEFSVDPENRAHHNGGGGHRVLDSSGVLVLPADLTSFRFNLGVRTREGGATATLTLRDASGAVVTAVSRAFPATYHEQQSASAFLGVSTLPAGGSIAIVVTSGSAIFYEATVDNTTSDPSLQIARPVS